MFDLEAALRDWKTAAQRRFGASELAELEDHLREEFARLVAAGQDPTDAWTAAIAKLGDPAEISAEFAKLNRLPKLDRIMLTLIIAVGVILIHAAVDSFGSLGDRHIFSLRLGRVIAAIGLLSGLIPTAVAAYETVRRVRSPTPILPLTQAALRLMRNTSIIAALLTIIGFGTVAIWDIATGGLGWQWWVRYSPRLLTAIPICIALVAAAMTARKSQLAPRIPFTITAIAGALIVLIWLAPSWGRHALVLQVLIDVVGCTICLAVAVLSGQVQNTPAISREAT